MELKRKLTQICTIISIRINISTSKNTLIKKWIRFPTLHISYGLGFIKGIIQFIILNQNPSENQKRLSR